jgi:iron complex outermembrane recepter protein
MDRFTSSARRARATQPVARSIGAAATLLVSYACLADPTEQPVPARTLQQITITADRLSATAPGEVAARLEAARVAGGTDVVGRDEYADGRASNLAEVFALAPGVFAQPRFGAEEARLSIRGSGLQRTFHSRGIYLLQDGVPITLADGSGDFQAIEPLALAYTEVMRGANALEFGGTTLGGSINFISPSGHDGGGLRPRIEGGSFGYKRGQLSAGDVIGATDYFASLSAYTQDGFRDWSQQKNERFFGNLGVKLRDTVETRLYLSAVHTDSQLPGSLTKAQLASDPEQANPGNLAGRQKRDFDLYRLANRTTFDLDGRRIEVTAGYSYKDLWHPIFQVLQQRSNDFNAGVRYVDEHELAGRANRFIAGVSPSWNRVNDDRFVNVAGNKGARTAASDQRSRNFTAYAENELDVASTFTLVTGAQWSDVERRYEDFFLSNGDQSLNASYTQLSPKLGLLWRGGQTWTVFGNVSDSYEPPSFGELTGGTGVSLLRAQSARTVELGTRGKASRVQWDVVAYSARVRDELLGLNSPTGQPLGTVNAPRTLHRGLELGADVAITSALTWRSSYLWSDFRFDGNAAYGDNALPGIPEHFYRGELVWSAREGYFVALNTEWSPRRYAIDMANSWFADAYALVGVKLGRNAEHGFSWFVEGRNLADRRYASTTGVIADARGNDQAQFLPGDGRSVYAGISWKPAGE